MNGIGGSLMGLGPRIHRFNAACVAPCRRVLTRLALCSPFLAAVLLLLADFSAVQAEGFRNPLQSGPASGQAGAYAAQADDPSAVYYNPAAMTALPGVQLSGTLHFVNPSTTFRNATGATAKNDINGLVGWPPPGALFATVNLSDVGVKALNRLTVGIGLISLYGFNNRYPTDAPFSSAIYQGSLPLLDIKPTIAYKVTDRLSVGLGADIYTFANFVGEGQAEQLAISPGDPGIPPGTNLELNGKGTTAGLNASVLYTLLKTDEKPRLNLAAIWRSQAVLPLKGTLLANGAELASASSSILLPEVYTLGLAGWPIRDAEHEWKLEVDVDYTRWQSIRNFDTTLSNGVTLPNPQRWSNAVNVAVGTEYRWLHVPGHDAWSVALRAGYLRSDTPVPDANFNPLVPDANTNVVTVGLGLFCHAGGQFLSVIDCGSSGNGLLGRKGLALDLAYQALLFEPRTVTGSPNPTVNGTYQSTTHIGTVSWRVNF